MKIIKSETSKIVNKYPVHYLFEKERLLFLDIETTGLSAVTSSVFLIGCAYQDKESNVTEIQFFAENPSEEKQLLISFFLFAADYDHFVTYNGNRFDIPFLEKRCRKNSLSYDFSSFSMTDLYKCIKPYGKILKLTDLKQKTVEICMNIQREDELSGRELIQLYDSYTKTQDDSCLRKILLHNFDDVYGVIKLLPLLAYHDLFSGKISADKVIINTYKDINSLEHEELIIDFSSEIPVPQSISYGYNDCYLHADGTLGKLRVGIFSGELRYYYPDFKNYYYLPYEDMAIHKSVARYVSTDSREPATQADCYIKKSGVFLPEWQELKTPVFRIDSEDPRMYFEITDILNPDMKFYSEYAIHILDMLFRSSK